MIIDIYFFMVYLKIAYISIDQNDNYYCSPRNNRNLKSDDSTDPPRILCGEYYSVIIIFQVFEPTNFPSCFCCQPAGRMFGSSDFISHE